MKLDLSTPIIHNGTNASLKRNDLDDNLFNNPGVKKWKNR